jgi:hypothetical protein
VCGSVGIADGGSPDSELLERMALELWLRAFEHPAPPRQERAETVVR